MRPDSVGAKTWLFGALAAWAACVWVLALFGLGGRVERLPEDPALLAPLPAPVASARERLGPLAQYAEIGARPLFSADRRPHEFLIDPDGQADNGNAFDFVLTSVLLTPTFQMAILQPTAGGDSVRLKIGDAPDAAPGWHLSSIDARSVVLRGPDGERKLELRVFDGSGGEPPSAAPAGTATDGMPPPSKPAQPAKPGKPTSEATSVQPASKPSADADGDPKVDSGQLDALRQRIRERRARQKQNAQSPATPAQKP